MKSRFEFSVKATSNFSSDWSRRREEAETLGKPRASASLPRQLRCLPPLLGLALLGALTSLSAPAPERASQPYAAYLFAHFTGESPIGEQIYFAVSTNGLNWQDLNNSAPVLSSNLGEKGVRDPALIRSADGKKFFLLATDLRIASGKGWDAARFQGSRALVCWESTDLLNWSEPWLVDVASQIPEAGCAWAPEAIYDDTTGDYIVYWATISPKDGVREARIYYAKTKDFRSFTPAELYIERVGTGVNAGDIIDTQIVRVDGSAYKYYRASRDTQITIEAANSILGEWTRIGDIAHLGYTARQVEGPILFQFNNQRKWCLFVDQYAAGRGYLPLVTTNLADTKNFQVLQPGQYSLGESLKRHGGILNITKAEYEALLAKWPSVPPRRIESLAQTGHFVRHADFAGRLAANVQPATDAQWRLVPGLAAPNGAVSLLSVNFPNHFLTQKGDGFALELNDGTDAFAARASFLQVAGLADAAGVSFQLMGAPDNYLLGREAALEAGPVATELDKKQATFRLVD
jgi:sucrose-6-phosphate hydrolase SacC (GH32 family)